ncbi:MAG: hypothetical protein WD491_10915, partial [Balneolales bacterium]
GNARVHPECIPARRGRLTEQFLGLLIQPLFSFRYPHFYITFSGLYYLFLLAFMDIFKLIFHHDLTLEHLSGNDDAKNRAKAELNLEDFMKPIPTYTRYYFSGTRLKENQFGLTTLKKKDELLTAIQKVLGAPLWLGDGSTEDSLQKAVDAHRSNVIVVSEEQQPSIDFKGLEPDDHSGVRDRFPIIKTLLDDGKKVVFLEKAHNGTDLHLFSKEGLYDSLLSALKPLVTPDFRYFSINGKRMGSERMFYFETWTLDRPPHGFEEVL